MEENAAIFGNLEWDTGITGVFEIPFTGPAGTNLFNNLLVRKPPCEGTLSSWIENHRGRMVDYDWDDHGELLNAGKVVVIDGRECLMSVHDG